MIDSLDEAEGALFIANAREARAWLLTGDKSSQIFVYSVPKAGLYLTEWVQNQRKDGKAWSLRASSLICVLLLALLTFVQVTHVHPVTDGDSCPICVVMHSAAPVAVAAPPVIVTTTVTPVLVPVVRLIPRQWDYTLFNRPPPAQA